jgi:hypothetical protein
MCGENKKLLGKTSTKKMALTKKFKQIQFRADISCASSRSLAVKVLLAKEGRKNSALKS